MNLFDRTFLKIADANPAPDMVCVYWHRMTLLRRSLSLTLWASWILSALLAIVPVVGHTQALYELVRSQHAMCTELLKNLNEFRKEPPMTCRRKFDPRYQDFSIPDWKPLSDEDALQAALALEKARAEKGPPTETVTRFAKTRAMVERAAASGELKVWEARFDIAHNGEKVRIVLVSNGECGAKHKYSENDPTFGVLLSDKFEADPRYRNLTHYPGDLFLYKGTTYVAKWSNFPGSTLNDRIPPPRRHRGYLLVQSIYWSTLTGEQAGPYETECQFGYEHLDSAKKGNEQ